jgi:hypothetical protein
MENNELDTTIRTEYNEYRTATHGRRNAIELVRTLHGLSHAEVENSLSRSGDEREHGDDDN